MSSGTGTFLRKLEAALDLTFVYEETAHLYSRRYGRPPIDPVALVKYLLVGYLYGIPSERHIDQRIQTDVALRWYLELDLFDRVPSTGSVDCQSCSLQERCLSQSVRHRGKRLVRSVFEDAARNNLDRADTPLKPRGRNGFGKNGSKR